MLHGRTAELTPPILLCVYSTRSKSLVCIYQPQAPSPSHFKILLEFLSFFFFFFFLRLDPQHMEVPRLRAELELQPPAYTTAAATRDLSHICDLHHSSGQRQDP